MIRLARPGCPRPPWPVSKSPYRRPLREPVGRQTPSPGREPWAELSRRPFRGRRCRLVADSAVAPLDKCSGCPLRRPVRSGKLPKQCVEAPQQCSWRQTHCSTASLQCVSVQPHCCWSISNRSGRSNNVLRFSNNRGGDFLNGLERFHNEICHADNEGRRFFMARVDTAIGHFRSLRRGRDLTPQTARCTPAASAGKGSASGPPGLR